MVFGAPDTFAIDAELEPGPELPPRVGSSAAGRIQLFCGGAPLGKRDEPCCVLGCIRDHLLEKCHATLLWHPQLDAYSPVEQFAVLDDIFFLGSNESLSLQEAVADCDFLTNVSEAFDGLKAFILRPPGSDFVVLVRVGTGDLLRLTFSIHHFAEVVEQFDGWLNGQEKRLMRGDA